jgi:ribosomal protein S18 acetylase RimI-like enzyme
MVTIEDVRDRADLPAFTQQRLNEIHEAAFGPDERQYSMDYMLERAGRRDTILRLIREGHRPCGYVYLELESQSSAAFLWYMAVDASLRNHGIGRRAVIDTLDMLRREYPGLRYVMFEVHRPQEYGDPERRALDSRLIEFYRRLGAYLVRGIDYRIPAADDPSRSVTYDPMFFILSGDLDPEEVRERVLLMASDNFEDNPDDPRWLSLQNTDGMTIVAPPEIDGA